MGAFDFLFGKQPTQQIIQQEPLRGPGYDWAQNFFNQYLPQFMGQGLPSYPGQLDPGLSPTMQALMRQGQNYSMSGYPDIMGQSAANLGRYMNQGYSPYQYQSGPEQGALQSFMSPQLISPQMLGGGPGGQPNFGFGQNMGIGGQNLRPLSGAQQGPQQGFGGQPGAATFFPLQPNLPSGNGGQVGPEMPNDYPRLPRPNLEGGGGSIPPGWQLPPLASGARGPAGGQNIGPDLSGITPSQYKGINVNPSFVKWDPFNPYPSMGPGGPAAFAGAPRQPGQGPQGPQQDPNGIVPQGQLEWFGNYRGPNAGMGREYAIADMWRRGWDMGNDYAPSQGIIDQWTTAGEPTTFGSKPTTYGEIQQRMGGGRGGQPPAPVLPGAPGMAPRSPGGGDTGGLRVGGVGAGSTFAPPQGGGGGGMQGILGNYSGPTGGSIDPGFYRGNIGQPSQPSSPKTGGAFDSSVISDMMSRGLGAYQGSNPSQLDPATVANMMGRGLGPYQGQSPNFAGAASSALQPRFPGAQPPGGMPPQGGPQMPPQGGPQNQGTGPLDVYRSMIPIVGDQLRTSIGDAMATSGLTGSRFSSGAQREAATAGARAGQQLGGNLMQLLYGQTEADRNRALQATGMGLQDRQFQNQLGFTGRENFFDRQLRGMELGGNLGMQQNQIDQSRLQLPFDMARYEQDRQDRYPILAMNDFNQGRMGYFPYLAQLAGAQGAGQYVPPIQTNQAGGPGAVDLASAILPWVAMFSDARLKRDIEPIPIKKAYDVVEGVPGRMFRWVDTGRMDAGVIAQEVEEVAPELVETDEMVDRKTVSLPGIVGHLLVVVQDLARRVDRVETNLEGGIDAPE